MMVPGRVTALILGSLKFCPWLVLLLALSRSLILHQGEGSWLASPSWIYGPSWSPSSAHAGAWRKMGVAVNHRAHSAMPGPFLCHVWGAPFLKSHGLFFLADSSWWDAHVNFRDSKGTWAHTLPKEIWPSSCPGGAEGRVCVNRQV